MKKERNSREEPTNIERFQPTPSFRYHDHVRDDSNEERCARPYVAQRARERDEEEEGALCGGFDCASRVDLLREGAFVGTEFDGEELP